MATFYLESRVESLQYGFRVLVLAAQRSGWRSVPKIFVEKSAPTAHAAEMLLDEVTKGIADELRTNGHHIVSDRGHAEPYVLPGW